MMKNLLITAFFALASIWLIAQTDILPPQLVKPLDEAEKQMPDALLDWHAVSGIGEITYTLEIDEDESFGDPVVFETNFTSVRMENLIFGNSYHWRVKAADNNGESDWTEPFSFSVFEKLSINKPDEGSIDEMPDANLSWKNIVGGKPISGLSHIEVVVDTLNSWNASQSVSEKNLLGVFFTSPENGYVVGESGSIQFYD